VFAASIVMVLFVSGLRRAVVFPFVCIKQNRRRHCIERLRFI
jgi:hypothetical protein